ncbi:hypothetical protein [Streptomyces sp. NPDC059787]
MERANNEIRNDEKTAEEFDESPFGCWLAARAAEAIRAAAGGL